MSIQRWSPSILLVEVQDDPVFSDEMAALLDHVEKDGKVDVVLSLASVHYLNSSNIAKLLKLRKVVTISNRRRLRLCGVTDSVWGLLLVTGLDKVFEFADDVSVGLASVQIDGP